MTAFEIPMLTTDWNWQRAFRPDALAAMQANPRVTRYPGSGRLSARSEIRQTMASFLGQWALRGYGVGVCERIGDGAFVSF
jgi:hypothetical protein